MNSSCKKTLISKKIYPRLSLGGLQLKNNRDPIPIVCFLSLGESQTLVANRSEGVKILTSTSLQLIGLHENAPKVVEVIKEFEKFTSYAFKFKTLFAILQSFNGLILLSHLQKQEIIIFFQGLVFIKYPITIFFKGSSFLMKLINIDLEVGNCISRWVLASFILLFFPSSQYFLSKRGI